MIFRSFLTLFIIKISLIQGLEEEEAAQTFPLTEDDFARAELIDDAELVAKYPKYGGPLQTLANATESLDTLKSVRALLPKSLCAWKE